MPANIHNDVTNKYFSGQGVLLVGTRDAAGKPVALLPLGNVSDLKISIATSTIDHKGSQDGQRAIDKRVTTETKVSLSIQLENYIARNLGYALRGQASAFVAGAATAEAVNGWMGAVTALAKINITLGTLVLTSTGHLAPLPLVEYVDDATPWDFKQNSDAGSFKLNDAADVASCLVSNSVLTITLVTGSATSPTITATHALQIGDIVTFGPAAVTGANAAAINSQVLQVATITATTSFTVQQIGGGNVVGTTIVVNGSPSLAVCYAKIRPSSANPTPGAVSVTAGAVSASATAGTTTLTVANSCSPGDVVFLANFTGAGGINLNQNGATTLLKKIPGFLVAQGTTPTSLVIQKDTFGQTITFTTGTLYVGSGAGLPALVITAAYSYSAQSYVDAMNLAPQELYMRFEGLNTADATITNGLAAFSPVVVEVWKFAVDPLKELMLLSDTISNFVLEGVVLSDGLKTTGSKFFKVQKIG